MTSEQSYFCSDSWMQQRCTRAGQYFDHHLKCFSLVLVIFHAQLITSFIANKTKLPNHQVIAAESARERFEHDICSLYFALRQQISLLPWEAQLFLY